MPGTVADVGHTDAMPACKENHTLSHLCWVQPDYISQLALQLCGHVTEHKPTECWQVWCWVFQAQVPQNPFT